MEEVIAKDMAQMATACNSGRSDCKGYMKWEKNLKSDF